MDVFVPLQNGFDATVAQATTTPPRDERAQVRLSAKDNLVHAEMSLMRIEEQLFVAGEERGWESEAALKLKQRRRCREEPLCCTDELDQELLRTQYAHHQLHSNDIYVTRRHHQLPSNNIYGYIDYILATFGRNVF